MQLCRRSFLKIFCFLFRIPVKVMEGKATKNQIKFAKFVDPHLKALTNSGDWKNLLVIKLNTYLVFQSITSPILLRTKLRKRIIATQNTNYKLLGYVSIVFWFWFPRLHLVLQVVLDFHLKFPIRPEINQKLSIN